MRKFPIFLVFLLLFSSHCGPTARRISKTDNAMMVLESNAGQLRSRRSAENLDKYVGSIIAAYNSGVASLGTLAQREKLAASTDTALTLLEQQVQSSPVEAHYFLVRKGELHSYVGQLTETEQAFNDSYRAKPNIPAAEYLLIFYAKRNDQTAINSLCQEAVMTTEDGDKQFQFIEDCRDATGAATEEGRMAWANDATKTFYREQLSKRQQIESENQRKAEIARAQEYERRRDALEYRGRVRANKQICEANCEENGGYCKRDCRSLSCKNACIDAQNACYKRCYQISKRDL